MEEKDGRLRNWVCRNNQKPMRLIVCMNVYHSIFGGIDIPLCVYSSSPATNSFRLVLIFSFRSMRANRTGWLKVLFGLAFPLYPSRIRRLPIAQCSLLTYTPDAETDV